MSGGFARILDEARAAGGTLACSCGRSHRIDVRSVTVAPGAIERIGAVVAETVGAQARLLVAADGWTFEAAGRTVYQLLADADHQTTAHVWRSDHGALTPDAEAVLDLLEAVRTDQLDALVAVGGGTVHDLTKFVATKTGLPFLSVPTAASVDAYLSATSALLSRGLKASIAGLKPPVAVLADVTVIQQAPPALIGSAVADQFSKVVCSADWILANHIHGTSICPRTWELNQGVLTVLSKQIELIAASSTEGYRVLMEALIDSGLGMLMYGSSLPASGSEHLIAHMLESIASAEGIPHTPHGHRVGVAALLVSELYSRLVALEPPELAHHASRIPDVARRLQDGSIVVPTIVEAVRDGDDAPASFQTLTPHDVAASWSTLRTRLKAALREHQASIRDVMLRAGAPTTYADLGFTAAQVAQAVHAAPYLRERYNILHLLRDMDLLDDWLPPALIAVAPTAV